MRERSSDLRRAALALAAVTALAVAAGACGRSSLFRGEDGIPLDTFGDGQDGDLVVASLADGSSDCRLLRATQDSALNAAGAASFEAGDMLLLWQVKGFGAVSGSANELATPGDAGRFEMLRAISVSSSRVVVEHTPSILYKTSGNHAAQVCRVPEYEDVTIGGGGALVARPWDSSVGTGGVISFLVKGTLLLFGSNSAVIASERGMAGGLGIDGDLCAGTVDLDAGGNPNCAGRKGEGIDAASYGPQRFGRGNRANGGGGGSGADGGGGGGGNGGAGGEGGQNFQGSPGSEGAGGTALLTTDLRLFFGGGGGAGHADDQPGRDGARGGGVVLIYARRIAGPGVITVAGQGAAPSPVGSGGAGGGAGGTIAIVVSSSTFTGILDARGGAGSIAVTGGHGPGGGGGGGRIDLRGGLVVGTAQVALAGGAGGVDGGGAPRGATSGSAGNLVLEP